MFQHLSFTDQEYQTLRRTMQGEILDSFFLGTRNSKLDHEKSGNSKTNMYVVVL
jgi:hypothetical protein